MNKEDNIWYKNPGFWTSIVVWIAIMLVPLFSAFPDYQHSLQTYKANVIIPIFMCITYYFNYKVLIPKIYSKKKTTLYIVVCITIALAATLLTRVWYLLMSNVDHRPLFLLMIMFKNIIIYIGTIAISFSVFLFRNYAKQEAIRQEAIIQLRESKIKEMQNEVSPHFLLNTLNNIYALTAFNTERAQSAILQLSKLLRHILYDNQQSWTPLHNVVDTLNAYINLMKIRLDNNVEITTKYQYDEKADIRVAPLIFIPLVENAFKHGISATQKCFIKIELEAKEENIKFKVENSNYPKTHDHSGHGIGLSQVEQRLELSYPGKYEWEHHIEKDNIYISKITLYDTKLRNH